MSESNSSTDESHETSENIAELLGHAIDGMMIQKLAELAECTDDQCPCAGHQPRCERCEGNDCDPETCDCDYPDCHWCTLYDKGECPCIEHKECGCNHFCNSDDLSTKCDCLCHTLFKSFKIPDDPCACDDIRKCYDTDTDRLICECECHEDDDKMYTETTTTEDDEDEVENEDEDGIDNEVDSEATEIDDDNPEAMDVDNEDEVEIEDEDDFENDVFTESKCQCEFCQDMHGAQHDFDVSASEVLYNPNRHGVTGVQRQMASVIRRLEMRAIHEHDDHHLV